jgi:hypothetical protein
VGKSEDFSEPARNHVKIAGGFLWKEGRLGPSRDFKELTAGKLTDDERKLIRKEFQDLMGKLGGFDFSQPVKVDYLDKKKIYVQFTQGDVGNWFTDTGFTEEDVGLISGWRRRELFKPDGPIRALAGTAAAFRDNITGTKLFKLDQVWKYWLKVEAYAKKKKIKLTDYHFQLARKRGGIGVRGGGQQYYVPNKRWMQQVAKGPDPKKIMRLPDIE